MPGTAPPGRGACSRAASATFCLVELQKLRHDRTELFTRAMQPVLWLLIFGETFNRIHAIPTGDVPYLDFLAPGIIAQSALFVSIFYGIQIIWERDAGVLTKLLVTPTPRSALVLGKSFAAGIRAVAQVVVVLVLSVVLRRRRSTVQPARHRSGAFAIVVLGAAFFCLPVDDDRRRRAQARPPDGHRPDDHDAALLRLERALPGRDHAGWLRTLSRINPLSYEVDALRGLLTGCHAHLGLDFLVLVPAVAVAVTTASSLVGRLAR